MNPQVQYPPVIQQRRTFWATLAWGLSALLITTVVCGTIVVVYGMNIADRKATTFMDSLENAAHGLAALKDSLPPILADAVNDERRPDYARQIEASAKLIPDDDRKHGIRPSVELVNRGDEVVSALSLRWVILNQNNEPVGEQNEWAATPIADKDSDSRGPLLPRSTRHFAAKPVYIHKKYMGDDLRVEVEITDVRLWLPPPSTRASTTRLQRTGPPRR